MLGVNQRSRSLIPLTLRIYLLNGELANDTGEAGVGGDPVGDTALEGVRRARSRRLKGTRGRTWSLEEAWRVGS